MKRKTAEILALCLGASLLCACAADADADSASTSTEQTAEATKHTPTQETIDFSQIAFLNATEKNEISEGEVALSVSTGGNPIVGSSTTGEYTYTGDPSILVDGDTVYLYCGHDQSKNDSYVILEYLCYSTTDLVNWTDEGSVMAVSTDEVSWASGSTSAWASQVMKYNDKYYLYYCTWDKTSSGKQSIGVAVSDSATGPFVDIGEPLVSGDLTSPDTSTYNDIDPTAWIETDEDGVEHRYLAWGNGLFYVCELNEDMISIKDLNGDGEITCGANSTEADIVNQQSGLSNYTEAPWLYRRMDTEGNYYGDYYLFYANGWREKMAYARTDTLMDGKWSFGSAVMPVTATSNTNHMAVFDFKGGTYFVYHNGSLPGGCGYRRSACITKVEFDEDGNILPIAETAAGLSGTISTITLSGDRVLAHEHYANNVSDNMYPYLDVEVGVYEITEDTDEADSQWVIVDGKADAYNAAYVSIQSENKPGLYLTANDDLTVTLAQDTDASEDTANRQTFHTVTGLSDESGVSFESVSNPGYYLTIVDNVLCLTDGSSTEDATFFVE
jgi:hypothetical protein